MALLVAGNKEGIIRAGHGPSPIAGQPDTFLQPQGLAPEAIQERPADLGRAVGKEDPQVISVIAVKPQTVQGTLHKNGPSHFRASGPKTREIKSMASARNSSRNFISRVMMDMA